MTITNPTVGESYKLGYEGTTSNSPFNHKYHHTDSNTYYKLTEISEIRTMIDGDNDVYNLIYIPAYTNASNTSLMLGDPKEVLAADIGKNIRMLVFTSGLGRYFYIPENEVTLTIDGDSESIAYQEVVCAFTIGDIPIAAMDGSDTGASARINTLSVNLNMLLSNTFGFNSTVRYIPASNKKYKAVPVTDWIDSVNNGDDTDREIYEYEHNKIIKATELRLTKAEDNLATLLGIAENYYDEHKEVGAGTWDAYLADKLSQ